MSRYDYNPMRYDYNNVPLNIPNCGDNESKKIADGNASVMPKSTLEEVGQEEAFSSRRKEYNEIYEAYTTFQQSEALRRATQKFFNGEQASESYLTQYGEKLDDFGKYIDKMTPEEYSETFKKLTGMELEEYRSKKAENPEFRFSYSDVFESKEKDAHIQIREDSIDYGREAVEEMANVVVTQRQENRKAANKQYYEERRSENAWNRDLNDICEFLDIGTTRKDVTKTNSEEGKNIAAMQQAIQAGDLEGFAVKFKEVTGNDFKIENFTNLDNAREKYNAAEDNSKEKEQLRKEYEQAIKTAYGNNVSQEAVDNYIKTKHISEGVTKGALIVGATIATGGIAGAVATGAAGAATAAGATASAAAVIGSATGSAAGIAANVAAAGLASAGYDYIANKTSAEPAAQTGKNAAEVMSYTTEGIVAAKIGKQASKLLPGAYGKALGIAVEIGSDTVASYGISKGFGHETTLTGEGIVSAAGNIIPRVTSVASGAVAARATKPSPSNIKGQLLKKSEGVKQEFVDIVKKERPYLSDEMAIMHAKRLQRVAEGKNPWEEGPINAYDRKVHDKFYETEAGEKDFLTQSKKIVKPDDKMLPVQKIPLTEQEEKLLDIYFNEGASHLSDSDNDILADLVRRSKPIEQDCVVYRTISAGRGSSNFNSAFIDEIKEGTVITRSTWTSTATEYDWACLQFHPDFASSERAGGKGYVMRINLPKGTKGIDLRGTVIRNGKQSEFMLPPNSQIKVNKIDHVNQILECDYILPKTEDYFPNEEFDMNLKALGKREHKWEGEYIAGGKDTTTLTYANRTIEKVENYKGWNVPISEVTTDTVIRPDGSTVTIKEGWAKGESGTIEKVVRDKNGKIIYKDVLDNQ